MKVEDLQPNDLRIGIAGAGATGGFLAASLADAGYDVTLLARGQSAEVIRREGIRVDGPDNTSVKAKPASVVEAGDEVVSTDVTLFCVKAYDTQAAAEDISGLVGDDGAILCLQNGVANEDMLARRYGADRIMSGVLYIGAERVKPGVIERSTQARVIFGPYDTAAPATSRLWPAVAAIFERAGIDCTVDENIRQAKWQKFLFNCGLNPLTAITRQRLGAIRSHPSGASLFTALVEEAISAARAAEAPLAADALEQVHATADRMDISSSMAEDLEAGRPMEVNAFTGHVLNLASEHGTDSTVTGVIHGLLEVLDQPEGRSQR